MPRSRSTSRKARTRTRRLVRRHWPLAAALLFLLIGGAAAYASFAPAQPSAAVLFAAPGAAQVDRGSGWEDAPAELGLRQTDKIRTLDGTATLVVLERHIIHLEPHTEIALATLDSTGTTISQLTGETWHKVARLSGAHYQVQTPTTVATVRGTEFIINDGNLAVAEGRVEFGPLADEDTWTMVEAGERAAVDNGTATIGELTDRERAKFGMFLQSRTDALKELRQAIIARNGPLLGLAGRVFGFTTADVDQLLADVDSGTRSADEVSGQVPDLFKTDDFETLINLTRQLEELQNAPASMDAPYPVDELAEASGNLAGTVEEQVSLDASISPVSGAATAVTTPLPDAEALTAPLPDAPAAPDAPMDAPAAPDVPSVPDAPAVPGTPAVPDAPAAPGPVLP